MTLNLFRSEKGRSEQSTHVRKRDIPTRCKKGKEVTSCPKARNALLGAMSFHAVRVRLNFSLRLDARRNRT